MARTIEQATQIERKSYESAIEMIDRENGIREYANWCGPRILAGVKGISAYEAAEILWNIQRPRVRGVTNMLALAHALGKKVESAAMKREDGSNHPKFSDRFPNLSEWLAENTKRFGVIRVGHSMMYVGFGQVIMATGFDRLQGKVIQVIWLD